MTKLKKKNNHYVDNVRFLEDIIDYKKKIEKANKEGEEKPRISEYCGKCIWLITENLALKPQFANYSFVDEMKSDAIENCLKYFDNFDSSKYSNPFAYFTQITHYAFIRRIKEEEKKRYIIYKKFQESILNTSDAPLLIDYDDNHLISSQMYDNLNQFIKNFEEREQLKKSKKKQTKEGLEKFIIEEENGK